MSWKCSQCGFERHPPRSTDCSHCGQVPGTLVLRGRASGEELRMRLATDIGRRLLGPLIGEDGRFVAEIQFRVRKDDRRGDWVVEAVPGVTNRTYIDGEPLDDGSPSPLGLGAELTIGPRGNACLVVDYAP